MTDVSTFIFFMSTCFHAVDWWHCDDGTVFKVQCPAESDSDANVEVPSTSTPVVDSVCHLKGDSETKKVQVVDLCSDAANDVVDIDGKDEEVQRDARRSPSKPCTRQPAHLNRARDVYMLSYVREKEMRTAIANVGVKSPAPPGVSELLQLSNSRNEKERIRYHNRLNRLKVRAENRKKEFDDLASSVKYDPQFYLVRTEFLKKWIVGDPSTLRLDIPLDGEDDDDDLERKHGRGSETNGVGCEVQQLNALCEHGMGLSPNAIESFKVVSSASYAVLTTTAEAKVDWIFNYDNFRCAKCFDGRKYSYLCTLINSSHRILVWNAYRSSCKEAKPSRSAALLESDIGYSRHGGKRYSSYQIDDYGHSYCAGWLLGREIFYQVCQECARCPCQGVPE